MFDTDSDWRGRRDPLEINDRLRAWAARWIHGWLTGERRPDGFGQALWVAPLLARRGVTRDELVAWIVARIEDYLIVRDLPSFYDFERPHWELNWSRVLDDIKRAAIAIAEEKAAAADAVHCPNLDAWLEAERRGELTYKGARGGMAHASRKMQALAKARRNARAPRER